MKKLLAVLLAGIMLLSFASCGKDNDTTDKDTFTVGICQLTKHTALDAATQGFIDALKAEFGDKVNILNENASGDAQTCTTIVNNFVNKNVDLIMANATPALQAAVNGTDTIPILGTSVTEYGTALGIKNFSGTVGGNVSGTSDLAPLDQQANIITELFPSARTVAILFCSAEANSRYQVDVVKAALQSKGLAVNECSFTESNDVNAAATLAAGSDVIYIPTDNKAADCATLIEGLVGDTPVVAGEENICKVCGVATLSINYYDLGKTTGEMAIKILKGQAKVSDMKIEYTTAVKKYNAAKCQALGINPTVLEGLGYIAID